MRTLRLPFALCIAACFIGLACTGSDPVLGGTSTPDGGDDRDAGATDGHSTGGSFALRAPAPVVVAPNETIKVAVEIERTGGFSGSVKIVIQPALDGIAVSPLSLNGDVTKGELDVTATPAAKEAITKVQLVATADAGMSDTKDLPFVVRGAAGKRETSFGESNGFTIVAGDYPYGIARTPDDGVVILGQSQVVRLLPDGKLDGTFGTGGKAALETTALGDTKRILTTKDGKIIVVLEADPHVYVHRLLANGAYDPAFGTAGVATYDFPAMSNQPYVFGADVDPNDRVVLGIVPDLTGKSAYARLLADGKIDTAFAALNLGTPAGNWRFLRAPGDTPLVFGSAFYDVQDNDSEYAMALVSGSSSAPKTLGGGFYTPDVYGVTVDAKGRMLIAGAGSYAGASDQTQSFATIIRANADGTVDGTFASGLLQDAFGETGSHARFDAALEEPSGRVIAIGQRSKSPENTLSMLLARYDDLGRPDASFGNNGVVLEQVPMVEGSAGGYLQTIPTIVVVRSYDPASIMVARYWR